MSEGIQKSPEAPFALHSKLNTIKLSEGGGSFREYKPERVISNGSEGEIYIAHDLTQEKNNPPVPGELLPESLVALKRTTDADARKRLIYEAQVTANLEHPYIQRVLNAGVSPQGEPYFATKLTSGDTLQDLIDKKDLTYKEGFRYLGELAQAVDYTNRNKVIHRDIKPANILITNVEDKEEAAADKDQNISDLRATLNKNLDRLDDVTREDRHVLLSDFGIALSEKSEKENLFPEGDGIYGSPGYMSPEQFEGGDKLVLGDSEEYAVALVAFGILAGQDFVEFIPAKKDGTSLTEEDTFLFMHGINGLPQNAADRLSAQGYGNFDGIKKVFDRALQNDKTKRYPDAVTFVETLKDAFAGGNENLVKNQVEVSYKN